MKIAVKFCGHCAPHMDMWEFSRQLQASLRGTEFSYLSAGETNADILLVLNACQVGCADIPSFSGTVIMVTPGEVDYWPVPPEGLLSEVIRKITGA